MKSFQVSSVFLVSMLAGCSEKSIAIVVYDDVSMLDVVGAYQTFATLNQKGYTLKFVAPEGGVVHDDSIQSLQSTHAMSEISSATILYIPGGEGAVPLLEDEQTLAWIRSMDAEVEFTVGVGEGALLLGGAGLLDGVNATTHAHARDRLTSFGANYTAESYSSDGHIYTGAGASSSLDIPLELIASVVDPDYARATQLFLEYDPNPPLAQWSPEEISSEVSQTLTQLYEGSVPSSSTDKTISILLYDGFTMLDVVGPYQVYNELRPYGYSVQFVSQTPGRMESDYLLSLTSTASFTDTASTDILIVPGSVAAFSFLHGRSPPTIDWIRSIDQTTELTTSVCTGALMLGEAGLLDGRGASTHWYAESYLSEYGATYSGERFTHDGKYVTGAGVSAGIDEALYVVSLLEGATVSEAIQRKLGYRPSPVFDSGTPAKSSPETVDWLTELYRSAVKRAL